MKAHRLVITFAAAASVAALSGAGAAATGATPHWLDALGGRSAALNAQYGLGDEAGRRALGAPGPDWLQALTARSDALNREYGLGDYTRRTARTSSTPGWLAALDARSDALNARYGLGGHAPRR
jgi:hypothetical protein